MTLTYFSAKSILETGFYMGKSETTGLFGNYCSLRPETWQLSIKVCECSRSMPFMMTQCSKIRLQASVLRTNGPLVPLLHKMQRKCALHEVKSVHEKIVLLPKLNRFRGSLKTVLL